MEFAPPLRRHDDISPDLEDLKPLPDAEYHRLAPSVRYLWFITRSIFWGIVFMGVLVFALFQFMSGSTWQPYTLGGIAVLVVLAVIHLCWPFISYPHWGYAIRQTDFLIRSGVLWKRVNAIPFARIQHVDNEAGPLERFFGIARLVIHTAGAQMGSLGVPGLPAERAESLRDYLSKVGHTHANI